MIGEKHLEIILEALSDKIKDLSVDVYFKDLRIKELEDELAKKGECNGKD